MKVRVIFELMGWPPEELVNALKRLMEALRKSSWKIVSEEYSNPEKIEGSNRMYSAFVEFIAEIQDLRQLFTFVMTYAPTVIEVLDPPEMVITANQIQDILADLTAKLQELDKQVKVLSAENIALKKKISVENQKSEETVKKVVLGENEEENS